MHEGGGGGAAGAAWETVKICPATVSVVERAAPLLAATLKATEPLPVPDAPPVIVTQEAPEVAVQAQPPPADTETVPVPPVAAKFWLEGEIP